MSHLKSVEQSGRFVEWLRQETHGRSLPDDARTRASAACFVIAQEHHYAIVHLLREQIFPSAFALLRPAFEAYTRGKWLSTCANSLQIKSFVEGREPPKLEALLSAIEIEPGFAEKKALSAIKTQLWSAMCDYTHTGGLHIQRWNTGKSIESRYSDEEIAELLMLANFVGAMSTLGLAEIANLSDLAQRVLNEYTELSGKGRE